MQNELKPCIYCKDYPPTRLPLKTNCDTSTAGALIAHGDVKREIVFYSQIGTYGIEINFCPICGRNLE